MSSGGSRWVSDEILFLNLAHGSLTNFVIAVFTIYYNKISGYTLHFSSMYVTSYIPLH